MNPEMDLDAVTPHDDNASQSQMSLTFASDQPDTELHMPPSTVPRASTPEPLPVGSSGFNWGKERNRGAEEVDGMGVIPTDTEGVGYLGNSICGFENFNTNVA